MIDILKNSDATKRREYILMEKIKVTPTRNIRFLGYNTEEVDCLYEISRLGSINWVDGKLQANEASGFLIRAKPAGVN